MEPRLIRSAAMLVLLAAAGFWSHVSQPFDAQASPLPGGPCRVSSAGTARLAQLPLTFVENAGQWPTAARFVARRGDLVLRVERGALALELRNRDKGALVRLCFEGCAASAAIEGEQPQPGVYNFFQGQDAARWRSGVLGYAAVRYRGLRDGVDVRLRAGDDGRLEYDLLLAPGVDVNGVTIRCEGTTCMRLEGDGTLVLDTSAGPLRHPAPIAWFVGGDGVRSHVSCRYRLVADDRFGFSIDELKPTLALVVDPGLVWSTYLGGDVTLATAVAVDATGSATVAGLTTSTTFPTTSGAFNPYFTWGEDAFVTKLSPSGASLVYSTYLGGGGRDRAMATALPVVWPVGLECARDHDPVSASATRHAAF